MNIALVGNQNSGKSTLFNILCGSNQKIGNWPGVTIDKKEGKILNSDNTLIDLPGIYSLNPYSEEEKVTINYLKNEKVDLIINVLDSTNLERSLYLTLQLKETQIDVVLAINMADLLAKRNIKLDINELSKSLHCSIFLVSSKSKLGINELISSINKKNYISSSKFIAFDGDLESLNAKEKDEFCLRIYGMNYLDYLIYKKYQFIENIIDKCCQKEIKGKPNLKLDKIFLNKIFGIPIFFLIMAIVYYISIGLVGGGLSSYLESLTDLVATNINNALFSLGVSPWLISLVCEGIITGVGAVLCFVPQLIMLFICLGILETSGYMSRISLLLDCFFHFLGLSGKSLIPFVIGSGCSVPAIMATKAIESSKEREKTIMLTPFIPCSAKLPLIILISSNLFPNYQGIVAISLYFLSFITIILVSLLMKTFSKNKYDSSYISELPEYKVPNFSYIIRDTYEKTKSFVLRAGTVIFLCSIVIWCLAHINVSFTYVDNDIKNSLLALIGKIVAPVFYPILGTNSWEASISIIQGIIAKEQVVSSMEIIAKLSNGKANLFLSNAFSFFTPLTAYSFCVFNMFSSPCISTIATTNKELKNKKKTFRVLLLQTSFAWILATLISLIGGLFV